MNVVGLDHVVLRVRDLDRMTRFYSDVLGCKVERTLAGLGMVQLRAGHSLIDLVEAAGPLGKSRGGPPDETAPNMDHFCLRIDPFDEAALAEHLSGHGVRVGEVSIRYGAEGDGPSLYIDDPEGNTVELKGPVT
ncbi:MAG: VOC family protein [Deltaproteobacteria bacterium]|nr:VOC family protein [Deltaproteobacteria bacterium]